MKTRLGGRAVAVSAQIKKRAAAIEKRSRCMAMPYSNRSRNLASSRLGAGLLAILSPVGRRCRARRRFLPLGCGAHGDVGARTEKSRRGDRDWRKWLARKEVMSARGTVLACWIRIVRR